MVTTLNCFGTPRSQPILASMYRHLAYLPSYLAFAWLYLAPMDADGRLLAAIGDARATAVPRASALAAAMDRASSTLPPGVASSIYALEPFVEDVILKMVVICALLHRMTPGADAASRGLEGVNG